MATLNAVVGGMTCGACARRVEDALADVPGVRSARVQIAARTATVEHDGTTSFQTLRTAVEDAGYTLESAAKARLAIVWLRQLASRPLIIGPVAGLALLGLYLGLIALAQGWEHALQQFEQDRPFVLALALGFGLQAGLYSQLRARHAVASAAAPSMAASSGTSTAAMLACCAHHLADILPIVGVSGLAVVLGAYKTPMLWLGLAMNLAGIAYLGWQLRRRVPSAPAAPITISQGVTSS